MSELKAAIYARYPANAQREESIEGQIRNCTAYAERNGGSLSSFGRSSPGGLTFVSGKL